MSPQNFGRPRWRSLVALEAGHAMLGVENHSTALALYFVFYNFFRIHRSLRTSPAMAAGVPDRLWPPSFEDFIDAFQKLRIFSKC